MRPVAWLLALAALSCSDANPPPPAGLEAGGDGPGAGGSGGTASGSGGAQAGSGGDPGPRLDRLATFVQPTDLRFLPGRPDVLVVAQQGGEILWHALGDGRRGTIASFDVSADGDDLLSLTFHPRYPADPRLFVHLTTGAPHGFVRVLELTLAAGDPVGPAASTRTVLEVESELGAHAGGQLRFGPAGMLHVAIGDGGAFMRRDGDGQDPDDLFGKILRFDVDREDPGLAYAIPPDNPFADGVAARPEVLALGQRNPWRMVFAPDGSLVVADVGESGFEEVNLVAPGDNHGWRVMEGDGCFPEGTACDTAPFARPYFTYPVGAGASISGGAVYGGTLLPALAGRYVMGDWVTGILRAIDLGGDPDVQVLGGTGMMISSVEAGPDGEIYVVDYGHGSDGGVYRLVGVP